LYLKNEVSDYSKNFKNECFGFKEITIERPLRLSVCITENALKPLRFGSNLIEPMNWAYEKFGDKVYQNIKQYKNEIEDYLRKHDIKLKSQHKKDLFSQDFWNKRLNVLNEVLKLKAHLGEKQFDDYNKFIELFKKTIQIEKLKLDNTEQKNILNLITWKNEDAERVIKKVDKDGLIEYEPDSDLRDTENVPLNQDIDDFFNREVLKYFNDAWIDYSKTKIGYEIHFTRYFTHYSIPRERDVLKKEIIKVKKEVQRFLDLAIDIKTV
jgi:type I restriction enzyme M protein